MVRSRFLLAARSTFRKLSALLFFGRIPFCTKNRTTTCRPSVVRLQRRTPTMDRHHCCRRHQSQYSVIFWLFDRPLGVFVYIHTPDDNSTLWYMFGKSLGLPWQSAAAALNALHDSFGFYARLNICLSFVSVTFLSTFVLLSTTSTRYDKPVKNGERWEEHSIANANGLMRINNWQTRCMQPVSGYFFFIIEISPLNYLNRTASFGFQDWNCSTYETLIDLIFRFHRVSLIKSQTSALQDIHRTNERCRDVSSMRRGTRWHIIKRAGRCREKILVWNLQRGDLNNFYQVPLETIVL